MFILIYTSSLSHLSKGVENTTQKPDENILFIHIYTPGEKLPGGVYVCYLGQTSESNYCFVFCKNRIGENTNNYEK